MQNDEYSYIIGQTNGTVNYLRTCNLVPTALSRPRNPYPLIINQMLSHVLSIVQSPEGASIRGYLRIFKSFS
jgi:hypothetical protein